MNRVRKRHEGEAFVDGRVVSGEIERELRNVLEFSAYMCEEDTIVLASLPTNLVRESAKSEKETLAERVRRFERGEIERSLLCHGNTLEGKKQAAADLGISLATLYNKLQHPIFPPDR